jgi:hypothetical protein
LKRDAWLLKNNLKDEFDAWLETDSTFSYIYNSVDKRGFAHIGKFFVLSKTTTTPKSNLH